MCSCVFRPGYNFFREKGPTFGDVYRHDRSMIDPAETLVDIVVFGVSSVAKTNKPGRQTPHARAVMFDYSLNTHRGRKNFHTARATSSGCSIMTKCFARSTVTNSTLLVGNHCCSDKCAV
jgi:hypothetical protein